MPRTSLLARLDSIPQHKLTLICAAAGFGKTTLITDWLAQFHAPTCWYSVDETDNQPISFIGGLITALNTQLRESIAWRLLENGEQQIETLLGALIEDCFHHPKPLILVLDDYHAIQTPEVYAWTKRLLEYAPAQLHVVMTSRKMPAFSISRLRSQGQVLEIKAKDLAFSATETADFFKVSLPTRQYHQLDIATIHQVTEGWVTGLQLWLLLSQQSTEAFQAVDTLERESQRYIFDYLSEQVFESQPAHVQTFLLTTALFERFCPQLCKSLLPPDESAALFSTLDAHHLFLIPLDHDGVWYRYHHLFREFLLKTSQQRAPSQVQTAYRDAALWFNRNGFIEESVSYALKAQDYRLAVGFIREHGRYHIWQQSAWVQVEQWIQALPLTWLHNDPHIAILQANMAAQAWRFDDFRRHLDDARALVEKAVLPASESHSIPLDKASQAKLLAELDALEFMTPASRGMQRQELTALHARMQKLDLRHEPIMASVVQMRYADMCFFVGDFEQAKQYYWQAIRAVTNQPNATVVLSALVTLARLARDNADWQGAHALCQEALAYARQWHVTESDEARHVSLWTAILYYERGDFEQSERAIQPALKMSGIPYLINSHIHLAKTLFMLGREAEALQTLHYARDLAVQHNIGQFFRIVERTLTWIHIRQNQTRHVRAWLSSAASLLTEQRNRATPSAPEELSLLFGAECYFHVGEYQRGMVFLDKLAPTLEQRARQLPLVRLKALQAIGYFHLKQPNAAHAALEQALNILTKSAFIMPISELGHAIAEVLTHYSETHAPKDEHIQQFMAYAKLPYGQSQPQTQLSYRELEVLRLIAIGYSNGEIAQKLYLTENTVKTHIKRLFAKLDANSRTHAVAQARAHNLL